MSDEQTPTPEVPEDSSQPTGLREITVSVPEDRVEQFQAFYERFLALTTRQGRHGRHGQGRAGRGRRGGSRRRHIRRAMFHLAMAESGTGSRRCAPGRRPAEEQATTQAPATSL